MIRYCVNLQKFLEENTNNRTALENPQTIFKDFKEKAHTICKAFAKKAIPHAKIEIQKMCDKLKSSLRDPSLDTEEKCLLHATLQERINEVFTLPPQSERSLLGHSDSPRTVLGLCLDFFWLGLLPNEDVQSK